MTTYRKHLSYIMLYKSISMDFNYIKKLDICMYIYIYIIKIMKGTV